MINCKYDLNYTVNEQIYFNDIKHFHKNVSISLHEGKFRTLNFKIENEGILLSVITLDQLLNDMIIICLLKYCRT